MVSGIGDIPSSREELIKELKEVVRVIDEYELSDKTNNVSIVVFDGGVTYIPAQVALNCLERFVYSDRFPCSFEQIKSLVKRYCKEDLYQITACGWVDGEGQLVPVTLNAEELAKGVGYIPAQWISHVLKIDF